MVYNSAIFMISPKEEKIVTIARDNSFTAFNVGKVNLVVKVVEGSLLKWIDLLSFAVQPGQGVRLKAQKNTRKSTGIKVVNGTNIKGYIHVRGNKVLFPDTLNISAAYFHIDSEFLKVLTVVGAAYVPVVGNVLAGLVGYFWPSGPSVWDQVKDKVYQALNQKTYDSLIRTAGTRLNYVKERIRTCAREVDDPTIKKTASHFMNIAEDLIGFEKLFMFNKNIDPDYIHSNYVLLPMWSSLINLKVRFYQFGVVNPKKIGLKSEQVRRLKDYINTTITQASSHIENVFKNKLTQQYDNLSPEFIYDQLSTVRSYCALNGFQHLVEWKAIAANPTKTKKPYNPIVVFSNYYGRASHILHRIQVPVLIPIPLQPKLVSGILNIPVKIAVFLNKQKSISALRLHYANNKTAVTGVKVTEDYETVNVERNVVKLIAYGEGQINALEFALGDGRRKTIGTVKGPKCTFSLDKHRIVGYYMTSSAKTAADLAANIAVSYQLIPM